MNIVSNLIFVCMLRQPLHRKPAFNTLDNEARARVCVSP